VNEMGMSFDGRKLISSPSKFPQNSEIHKWEQARNDLGTQLELGLRLYYCSVSGKEVL